MNKSTRKIEQEKRNKIMKRKVRSPFLKASRFVFVGLAILFQIVLSVSLITLLKTRYFWFSFFTDFVGLVLFLYVMAKDVAAVYKLPWIVLFCLFPYAGIVIYLTFGRIPSFNKKYLKRTKSRYKPDLSLVPEDANLIRYVAAAYGAKPTPYARTEYLPTGERYAERLLEELEKAERYIFIEYFIVEDGEFWDSVFAVLKKKIKSGVEVYFLYDDVGSIKKVPVGFRKKLEKEGLNARVFRRFVPIASALHNNRDHRKIVVIDGITAFTGGLNLADEYVNITHPFGRWLDNGIILQNGGVDEFVRMFVSTYNLASEEKLAVEDFVVPTVPTYEDGLTLPFGDCPYPVDTEHIGENAYVELIHTAKRSLIITTPYFVVDTNVTEAIKSALFKGVRTQIIIPQIPDKKAVYAVTKHTCSVLRRYGAEIYMYKGGFIHAKTVVADGKQAVIGTVNMDYRSFTHHYECGVALYKTSCIADIEKDLLRNIDEECFRCGKKALELSFGEKITRILLAVFSPLM